MHDTRYLKDLILLRNDPSKVPAVREAALCGEADAQFAMGLIYAEGRGVPEDLAQAHYWLSLAVAQGDKEAERLRARVGARMTDDEYAAAKRLREGANLSITAEGDADHGGMDR
ncbi:sel1 repeat family protein [Thioalkalicoccus limnaeus]|uniref:Sel1 repeat family protein n=1 Tax=Thioalkalicoccus limnaeus TaxID=120681 RepID=A0ABV4BJ96_9GAMM